MKPRVSREATISLTGAQRETLVRDGYVVTGDEPAGKSASLFQLNAVAVMLDDHMVVMGAETMTREDYLSDEQCVSLAQHHVEAAHNVNKGWRS